MWNWDYNIPRNWKPKTPKEWQWFFVRKINLGEFKGLPKTILKKFFPAIKKMLDPGKRAMLEHYFGHGHTK